MLKQKLGERFVNIPTTDEFFKRVRIAAAQKDCSVAEFGRRALESALKELEKSEAAPVYYCLLSNTGEWYTGISTLQEAQQKAAQFSGMVGIFSHVETVVNEPVEAEEQHH